jgi:hypothetical protein
MNAHCLYAFLAQLVRFLRTCIEVFEVSYACSVDREYRSQFPEWKIEKEGDMTREVRPDKNVICMLRNVVQACICENLIIILSTNKIASLSSKSFDPNLRTNLRLCVCRWIFFFWFGYFFWLFLFFLDLDFVAWKEAWYYIIFGEVYRICGYYA